MAHRGALVLADFDKDDAAIGSLVVAITVGCDFDPRALRPLFERLVKRGRDSVRVQVGPDDVQLVAAGLQRLRRPRLRVATR